MSDWNIPKEYLDQSKEIERLTTDRDEWERLWKKASVSVIDLQDEVEKLKEDRLDFRERIAELESEVKLWRDNEQNCLDALNRIDELKSLLKGDDL